MQRQLVLKLVLFSLLFVSLTPLAFAQPSIELSSDQNKIGSLDSFLVYGKVTGVEPFSKVEIDVIAPDGEGIYSFIVSFDDEGTFKRLIHPPLPSFKPGVYTVVASHEKISHVAQIQFSVIGDGLPRGILQESPSESELTQAKLDSDMYILANAIEGDTEIKITGKTIWTDRPVTLKVSSPTGNLITVAQVTPQFSGDFSTSIKIGGPLWKEDGVYTVSAFQGDASELTDTVKVEIANGVVVPEFGTIAVMILAMSIISLVVFSAKSRLAMIPRF